MSRHAQAQSLSQTSGWQGNLELKFERINKRTALGRTKRTGPLCVQRPFYPEGEVCHVYLLHPPGGFVGGDALNLNLILNSSTHALITTPGAQRVYKSNGQKSRWEAIFHVDEKATLEWLPQDTILFGGSRWHTSTQVHLHPAARFFGWELTSLGRPAAKDHYQSGDFEQRMQITVDAQPILVERFAEKSNGFGHHQLSGLQGHQSFANLYAYPACEELLEHIQHQMAHEFLGATLVDNLLIVRLLARSVQPAVSTTRAIWSIWRKHICQIDACIPRIWYT